MPWCTNGEVRLRYSERGDPSGRPVVMVPGLFFSHHLHARLAQRLRSYRFLLLNPRGHGESSSPEDPAAYGWRAFASDVRALLDHLDLDRAVVGGSSLGANITVAFAADHASRLDGAIVEMPVLDAGRARAHEMFTKQADTLTARAALIAPVARVLARLPDVSPELASLRDLLSRQPVAGAALLRSLLEDEDTLHRGVAGLTSAATPTLVIGHRNIVGRTPDALHHIDDAQGLAGAVPGARLVEVGSMIDLRLSPARYADIVGNFLAGLGTVVA